MHRMLTSSLLSSSLLRKPCRQTSQLLSSLYAKLKTFLQSLIAPEPHQFSVICRKDRYVNSQAQAASPLFSVPLDIFLVICDRLPLASLLFLSQTCFDARSRLEKICLGTISQLDANAYLGLLVDLAYVLPDYQVCVDCSTLHQVDVDDLPSSSPFYRNACMRRPKLPEEPWEYYLFGPGYCLAHHHVALALKYHRLGNSYQEYLGKLMTPYTWSSSIDDPLKMTYTAKPMVVNGEFLLFTIRTFEHDNRLGFQPLATFFMICPHARYWFDGREDVPNCLTPIMHRVAKNPRLRVSRRCNRCPTDYKIFVAGGRLVCHVWQNMGCPLSQIDKNWRIFCHNPDNRTIKGPTIRQKPHSVRMKFSKRKFDLTRRA